MSVMANRPVGVGEGAAPTVTVNERTRRLPRRSLAVLEERSTSIEYRVQPARNRDGSSLTQPSFPRGSSGVETPAHRPRWAKTANTVGDPNSVREPTRLTTFPPGAVRSGVRPPRRSHTIGWPRWARATRGWEVARGAAAPATVAGPDVECEPPRASKTIPAPTQASASKATAPTIQEWRFMGDVPRVGDPGSGEGGIRTLERACAP